MKIDTIFCDVDGVLADFRSHICRKLGRDPGLLPRGSNDLASVFGMTYEQMMKETRGCGFWESMPICDSAWPLLFYIRTFCDRTGARLIFLTKPDDSPDFYSGRYFWLKDHMGFDRMKPEMFLPFPVKELLAAPGRVLIDDDEGNVFRFRDKGGDAVLYPMIGNSRWQDRASAVDIVQKEILDIITK